jgi:hypothetical protein
MKNYILREQVEQVLAVMNHFADHDAFLVDIDSSSGIGTTITLSLNIIHQGVAGKFTVDVTGPDTW